MTSGDREFLLRSLADLEAERAAGDLDEADYRDLRARYQRRLETLDRSGGESVRAGATDAPGRRRRRGGRGVLTAVVVAVIALGAGIAVAQLSGSREPGEQLSGSVPSTSAQRLQEAADLFQRGEIVEAAKVYDAILAEDPDDVAALTYKGWMLRNVSVQGEEPELLDRAIELLERATDVDPAYAEAWFFRGIIYLRDENEPAKAVDALRLALAAGPIPELERAARELLSEIAQMTSSTTAP